MKNWNDIAVGDSIFNKDGDEAKVLEVGASGKTFLKSWWNDGDRLVDHRDWEIGVDAWYHVERAKQLGWILGEAKKNAVQEFDEWLRGYQAVGDIRKDKENIVAKVKELFDSK